MPADYGVALVRPATVFSLTSVGSRAYSSTPAILTECRTMKVDLQTRVPVNG
jgi:hypothetical protein